MYNIVTACPGVLLLDHTVKKVWCDIRKENVLWCIFLKITKKIITIVCYFSFHYKKIILLCILLAQYDESKINISPFFLVPFIKGTIKMFIYNEHVLKALSTWQQQLLHRERVYLFQCSDPQLKMRSWIRMAPVIKHPKYLKGGLPMKILIVDDSMVMRNIHKNILIENKISEESFLEARDGNTALDMARKEYIDIFLVDWNMPGLDGLQLLKALREMEKYNSTPIIMITSEAAKYNVMEAIEAGISDYIIKPIKGNVLWDKISKYFK
jgi:two-component system chemotaxis response regulator CheY